MRLNYIRRKNKIYLKIEDREWLPIPISSPRLNLLKKKEGVYV